MANNDFIPYWVFRATDNSYWGSAESAERASIRHNPYTDANINMAEPVAVYNLQEAYSMRISGL